MSDEKRTEATESIPAQADAAKEANAADAASDAKAIKGKTNAQAALDKTARLDNTQELPPLPDDLQGKPEEAPIKQPFPQTGDEAPISDVRELTPDKALQQRAKQQAEARKKQQSWFLRHKKPLLLGVGFLIAVFIGFALAGYRQDQADLQNNERQHQEQQMQERAQKLDAQESDLQKQRRDLEAKKKALEEQQRDLERQQGRIEGRSQAMQESADGESGLQKIIDKVTGQSEKKQQAAEANRQQGADAAASAANVQQSINDAQSMLDDVQQKLDDVQAMKNEAGKVKDKAASTYEENKDTIDTVLSYAKEGATMLGNLLFQ